MAPTRMTHWMRTSTLRTQTRALTNRTPAPFHAVGAGVRVEADAVMADRRAGDPRVAVDGRAGAGHTAEAMTTCPKAGAAVDPIVAGARSTAVAVDAWHAAMSARHF